MLPQACLCRAALDEYMRSRDDVFRAREGIAVAAITLPGIIRCFVWSLTQVLANEKSIRDR
jgi:hypothetical protein